MSRIKETFDAIHAEETLIENTRAFLNENTGRTKRRRSLSAARLVPAAACFLLLTLGGYRYYFAPTSVISIDINPSLELWVNRYDKVVSVKEYNDDGNKLANSLDIRFMGYAEALDQILASDEIKGYLSQDEWLTITVVRSEEEQGERILSDIESCVEGHGNTSCHSADLHDVEAAHAEGLSYGKYCALLELQKIAPEMTAEDIYGMTMCEIENLIQDLSGETSGTGDGSGTGGHGHGYGHGHGGGHHGRQHGE